MEGMRKEARKKLAKQRRVNRWHKVVNVLAGIVVFCTTYALVLPAITMTTPMICGYEVEHTHTDECYTVETITYTRELTCERSEVEPHTHEESCYAEATIYDCGLEEAEAHTHDESCTTLVRGELTCTTEFDTVENQVTEKVTREVEQETTDGEGNIVMAMETITEEVTRTVTEQVEHVHTDDCYAWTEEVTCELAETEGHAHTEDCGAEAGQVLSCETEVTEGHAHTDECYFIPDNEGETEEIRTLICELPEHTHDDNCYLDLELEENIKMFCGFDTEHTHNEDCYFEDGELKCTIAEHTHTDECLVEPVEPEIVALDDTFTAEREDVVVTLHVTGEVILPELDETVEDAGFELVLTESEDEAAWDEYAELAAEDGDVMMVQVLNYTLTYGGQEVDLSQCEVTVEVTPTEAFEEMINSPMEIMTLALENEDEEQLQADMAMVFSAYTAERPGVVAYVVVRKVNPEFTVQFYANLNVPESTKDAEGTDSLKLSFIDTSESGLGRLPKNGDTAPNLIELSLNQDGTVLFNTKLTEIYKAETKEFNPKLEDSLDINYLNSLRDNEHYKVTALWVLKDGKKADSKEESDWTVYKVTNNAAQVVFTNNEELAGKTDENGRAYIVVNKDTVMRLVYDPADGNHSFKSTFYDYDISKGDKNATTMYTQHYGINSHLANGRTQNGNARYAFGNGNMHTDFENDKRGNYYINRYESKTYLGLSLGLVSGMTADGTDVVFSNGITGPSIGVFGIGEESSGTGKIIYPNWNLNFNRAGDTFTLSSVSMSNNKTVASGLESFNHPSYGSTYHSHIWTNNFWPLDDKWSAQPNILDPMFGGAHMPQVDGKTTPANQNGRTPPSDDGIDHNSYFGMAYSVDFDLVEEYVGPLEYYFFGDDDMWVFLDGKLVCDIGGVHSSVGEYVDLWDHIAGGRENHAKGQHTLSIFYTERGASGSSCWMQFTLPQISQTYTIPYDPETAGLTISKISEGTVADREQEFPFVLTLGNIYNDYEFKFVDADGAPIEGKTIRNTKNDSDVTKVSAGTYSFTLKSGEKLLIIELPEGTTYHVEETYSDANCSTTVKTNSGDPVEGVLASGKIAKQPVTIAYTNIFGFELPATGGAGTTLWYTMGTLLMAAAAFLMYNKKKQEGDVV